MTMEPPATEGERLNRYLARCGVASRRKAEAVILAGRIRIDGRPALSPADRVGPGNIVTLDGKRVSPRESLYLVLNKPRGLVCAVSDRFDRTVMELLSPLQREQAPYPVGRLDKDSEGLLLLTNDGDFAQQILHPSGGVTKTYEVRLDKPLSEDHLNRWRQGIDLEEGLVVPRVVSPVAGRGRSWVSVTLNEGLKREVRRMAAVLGYRVLRLKRCAIGRLLLRELPVGASVALDRDQLWKMVKHGGIL